MEKLQAMEKDRRKLIGSSQKTPFFSIIQPVFGNLIKVLSMIKIEDFKFLYIMIFLKLVKKQKNTHSKVRLFYYHSSSKIVIVQTKLFSQVKLSQFLRKMKRSYQLCFSYLQCHYLIYQIQFFLSLLVRLQNFINHLKFHFSALNMLYQSFLFRTCQAAVAFQMRVARTTTKVLWNNFFNSKTKICLRSQRVIQGAVSLLQMIQKIVPEPNNQLKVIRKLSLCQLERLKRTVDFHLSKRILKQPEIQDKLMLLLSLPVYFVSEDSARMNHFKKLAIDCARAKLLNAGELELY